MSRAVSNMMPWNEPLWRLVAQCKWAQLAYVYVSAYLIMYSDVYCRVR